MELRINRVGIKRSRPVSRLSLCYVNQLLPNESVFPVSDFSLVCGNFASKLTYVLLVKKRHTKLSVNCET